MSLSQKVKTQFSTHSIKGSANHPCLAKLIEYLNSPPITVETPIFEQKTRTYSADVNYDYFHPDEILNKTEVYDFARQVLKNLISRKVRLRINTPLFEWAKYTYPLALKEILQHRDTCSSYCQNIKKIELLAKEFARKRGMEPFCVVTTFWRGVPELNVISMVIQTNESRKDAIDCIPEFTTGVPQISVFPRVRDKAPEISYTKPLRTYGS